MRTGVQSFIRQHSISDAGVGYQVVAITGPQSSGKSTLMNAVVSMKPIVDDSHPLFRSSNECQWQSNTAKSKAMGCSCSAALTKLHVDIRTHAYVTAATVHL